jgi:hypothetical protein
MLPQLVLFAATIGAVWFLSRWVIREIVRVENQIQRLQRILAQAATNRIPHLRLDPATGLYIPAKF